ncbi:hypothetical protein H0H92_009874 [Tricholoma furcatifolium]|nr:hypothetical protein H0H92_009874 [Tricholoma furcatifolium]
MLFSQAILFAAVGASTIVSAAPLKSHELAHAAGQTVDVTDRLLNNRHVGDEDEINASDFDDDLDLRDLEDVTYARNFDDYLAIRDFTDLLEARDINAAFSKLGNKLWDSMAHHKHHKPEADPTNTETNNPNNNRREFVDDFWLSARDFELHELD